MKKYSSKVHITLIITITLVITSTINLFLGLKGDLSFYTISFLTYAASILFAAICIFFINKEEKESNKPKILTNYNKELKGKVRKAADRFKINAFHIHNNATKDVKRIREIEYIQYAFPKYQDKNINIDTKEAGYIKWYLKDGFYYAELERREFYKIPAKKIQYLQAKLNKIGEVHLLEKEEVSLLELFQWRKSSQGFDYWNKIYHHEKV